MAVSEGAKLKESSMQFVVSKQNLQKELGLVQGVVDLPVPNSKIFLKTPGAIAEIGLTRSTGCPRVPTTS